MKSVFRRLLTWLQVLPERLARANEKLRGIRVGDFELVAEPLHLGAASGNRFELTLRYFAGNQST